LKYANEIEAAQVELKMIKDWQLDKRVTATGGITLQRVEAAIQDTLDYSMIVLDNLVDSLTKYEANDFNEMAAP